MEIVTVVQGDITQQEVDAVVNAANNRMRGGGGVDGAIHRAGGPAVLEDCVRRFPDGLATGDAGWTTAGEMPARWVIHVVGPNYAAGQRDRSLLTSCYSRALEVADELGAATVAFPLVSAGIYGWPKDDAIAAALEHPAIHPHPVTRPAWSPSTARRTTRSRRRCGIVPDELLGCREERPERQGLSRPVFVLHDHRKPAPHFDLRLEEDGVLKSWAVPRGLPTDYRRDRLAVQVGDHDLDHATYTDEDKDIADTGWWELEDRTEKRFVFVLHGREGARRYADDHHRPRHQ